MFLSWHPLYNAQNHQRFVVKTACKYTRVASTEAGNDADNPNQIQDNKQMLKLTRCSDAEQGSVYQLLDPDVDPNWNTGSVTEEDMEQIRKTGKLTKKFKVKLPQ